MQTARRCAVALILGTAIAAATAAQTHEILHLGKSRVYQGEMLDGHPHGERTLTDPLHDGSGSVSRSRPTTSRAASRWQQRSQRFAPGW